MEARGEYSFYHSLPAETQQWVMQGLEKPTFVYSGNYGPDCSRIIFKTAKDRDLFLDRCAELRRPALSQDEIQRFYRLTENQQNYCRYLLKITIEPKRLDIPLDNIDNVKSFKFKTFAEKKIFLQRLEEQEDGAKKEALREEVREMMDDATPELIAQVKQIKTGCQNKDCLLANNWIDCLSLDIPMLEQAKNILDVPPPLISFEDSIKIQIDTLLEACELDNVSPVSTGILCALAKCKTYKLSLFASSLVEPTCSSFFLLKQTLLEKKGVYALFIEVYPKMMPSHQEALTGLVGLELPRGMESIKWAYQVTQAMMKEENNERIPYVIKFLENLK